MLERLAPAALAAMLLGLALTGTVPAGRRQRRRRQPKSLRLPRSSRPRPQRPRRRRPPTRQLRHLLRAPTPAVAEPPPPPPVDPLLAEVRRQLAEPAARQRRARRPRRAHDLLRSAARHPSCGSPRTASRPGRAMPWPRSPRPTTGASPRAPSSCRSSPQGEASPAALADAEIKLGLAVLKYARHARGGRLDPRQLSKHLDMKPTLREPKAVLDAVAATDTPGDYLRDAASQAPAVPAPAPGPAQGAWRRQRSATLPSPRAPTPRPCACPTARSSSSAGASPRRPAAPASERAGVARAPRRFSISSCRRRSRPSRARTTSRPRGLLTPRTRTALNGGVPNDKPQARPAARGLRGAAPDRQHGALALDARGPRRVPRLGQHPRVHRPGCYKKGQVIHSAKIIVGKPETQTAVFSANMKFLVFHPEWGVPDSIKLKEIAPYLVRRRRLLRFFGTDTSILTRQQPAGQSTTAGRSMPRSVNWGSVDITPLHLHPVGRARTTCWASSSSASPTSTTSTCTTRRSASCSRSRCALQPRLHARAESRRGWPSCCSQRTRAGRPTRCAACWPRATTTRCS